MEIREFQRLIEQLYLERDSERGLEGTYMWFAEEVGELTRALRRGHEGRDLEGEFADVFAWLVSLASLKGVDLQSVAIDKYFRDGIPGHEKDRADAGGE
ncbi:MAG: MazG nucleotide pyrophosphohydrolase domain-containing protein [Planctomycetota bacterium]|jgi:NTP pyrophosphatase (non-canonical NTP hydrolase)